MVDISDPTFIPLAKCLASYIRLRILEHIGRGEIQQKQLAIALDIKHSTMNNHVAKLEELNLIGIKYIDRKKYLFAIISDISISYLPMADRKPSV